MCSVEVPESDIPEHLRVKRTFSAITPPNYLPPFPAYSARFSQDAKRMVTAIIGVQHKSSVLARDPLLDVKRRLRSMANESGFESWWSALKADGEDGYFLEVFLSNIDRFETVFSNNNEPEGVANMRIGVIGTLQEHVYCVSMRARLPASQTDHLKGEKATIRPTCGKEDTNRGRINVEGMQNLAMIRSGQDCQCLT